jgi:hypothetical protein
MSASSGAINCSLFFFLFQRELQPQRPTPSQTVPLVHAWDGQCSLPESVAFTTTKQALGVALGWSVQQYIENHCTNIYIIYSVDAEL